MKKTKNNLFLIIFSLLFMSSPVFAAEKPYYVGSDKCNVCHPQQYDSWKKTKMGTALLALSPMKYNDKKERAGMPLGVDHINDHKCLLCHSTGFGADSGYNPLQKNKGLQNVGCEMCHGAASRYMEIMISNPDYYILDLQKAGLELVNEGTCTKCHNDNDIFSKAAGFKFKKMIKIGIHDHFPLERVH